MPGYLDRAVQRAEKAMLHLRSALEHDFPTGSQVLVRRVHNGRVVSHYGHVTSTQATFGPFGPSLVVTVRNEATGKISSRYPQVTVAGEPSVQVVR